MRRLRYWLPCWRRHSERAEAPAIEAAAREDDAELAEIARQLVLDQAAAPRFGEPQ